MIEMITELEDFMEEELEGACDYIDMALKYRFKEKELAEHYCKLAEDELKHGHAHYEWAKKIMKANALAITPEMTWKFNYKVDEYTKYMNKIAIKIKAYKE